MAALFDHRLRHEASKRGSTGQRSLIMQRIPRGWTNGPGNFYDSFYRDSPTRETRKTRSKLILGGILGTMRKNENTWTLPKTNSGYEVSYTMNARSAKPFFPFHVASVSNLLLFFMNLSALGVRDNFRSPLNLLLSLLHPRLSRPQPWQNCST